MEQYDSGLVVWIDEAETVNDLCKDGPTAAVLLFSRRPIPWPLGVETWERDQAGKGPAAETFLEGALLLPQLGV